MGLDSLLETEHYHEIYRMDSSSSWQVCNTATLHAISIHLGAATLRTVTYTQRLDRWTERPSGIVCIYLPLPTTGLSLAQGRL